MKHGKSNYILILLLLLLFRLFLATSGRKPTIKDFSFNLVDNTDHKLVMDKALSKPKFWTKVTDWSKLTLKASSHYKPEIDSATRPNYITDYTIGIDDMDIGLTLFRGIYFT
jgi:hypothetical protein